MKKLKIPLPYVLAGLLVLCSVGLPILLLQLGELGSHGKVVQEPLPYNLNVEQEPYSVSEKMELIMSYEITEENFIMSQQELTGTELWNKGLVKDVTDKKLAAICSKMGLTAPEMEISGAFSFTLTDRTKPALSLRMWAVMLESEDDYAEMVLDVDTGSVYFFTMSRYDEGRTYEDYTEAVFAALQGQIAGEAQWYLKDDTAIMYDDGGMATFNLTNNEWGWGWSAVMGSSQEEALAEKNDIPASEAAK